MELTILTVFILGYLFIAFEHSVKINKAGAALVTGVLCWTIYILNAGDKHLVAEQLTEHLAEAAGILFFLLGAMTIVELIDSHNGFDIITSRISSRSKRKLLWTIAFLSFFLSAVLDNLTTSIVMVSLARKLINDRNDRLIMLGIIIIAANAGGAWSPIGDVTTTMLWIGGQVSSGQIILNLFIPSLISLLAPLAVATLMVKGKVENTAPVQSGKDDPAKGIVFWSGVAVLIMVPVFKSITHLPPYMGILLGLGLLWVITEIIHKRKNDEEKHVLSVAHALRRADTPSVLFFLGILLAIGALQSTGQLAALGIFLDQKIGNISLISMSIGLISAVIDNVPMVAGAMGMYDISSYPMDHYLWEFLAYCAGTGGSILVIGSAAGVAVMGMENISFGWYLKKVSWLALLGYLAGAAVYILQKGLI